MKPIGRTDIWREGLALLCQRYLLLHPDRRDLPPAETLAARVEQRAAGALGRIDIPAAPPLRSVREWESRWDHERQQERLTGFFRRRGIAVALQRASHPVPGDLAGLAPEEDETLVLDLEAARQRAGRLREAGLLLAIGEKDGLLLMLCDEVYTLAMAAPDAPAPDGLLDRLAPHEFARVLLGLPFHPWVADLVEGEGS